MLEIIPSILQICGSSLGQGSGNSEQLAGNKGRLNPIARFLHIMKI